MPEVIWRTSCRLGALCQHKASYKLPSPSCSSKPLSQSLSNQDYCLPGLELVPASLSPSPPLQTQLICMWIAPATMGAGVN